MADDKKSDDYTVQMDKLDQGNKEFEAAPPPQPRAAPPAPVAGHPALPVLAYCGSSIMMTVMNKYVLSGLDFNLNFLLLMVQSLVCIAAIQTCKSMGLITYRDFSADEARKWFPITLLLIGMIYTGSKALQFLSIPVYTIFKNLTIILIAYGEVLWFGGSVTGLTLFSFGLMVFSSLIAAWADIKHAVESSGDTSSKVSTLNAGYVWMLINCLCTSSYVLGMRKRIKLTNFKDFDSTFYKPVSGWSSRNNLFNTMTAMFYNNLLSIPVLIVLTLLVEDWSSANLARNFPEANRNGIAVAMILSGLSSVFISYTSAWCVRVTSSTTYSMVGALNKLPIAVSGLVFFDAPVTFPSVSAIVVGFVSGLVYAVAKIKQNAAPRTGVLPTSNPLVSASSQSMRDSLRS
ncbi:hypothetical protein N7532_007423 [Penicillium argentinense]|uniref:GDP-mannose transporter n=1 Tax=Penicillium argentinense TaxID=1131581 RepID=A0A9W9K7L0_9EURO|nr:uncharacterized protein N7532_007423 [Penicillium argentinense]KAJ5095132.1 hypothetical protein N7532_007423 [Penicillium argentinense]